MGAGPGKGPVERVLRTPSGLEGTLLTPWADAPLVLIIPGSGPTDRDGNNSLGIRAAPYRLLAQGLAARGMASVRIDKRGMFGSREAQADPDAVTIEDYADDLAAWIATLRRESYLTPPWLLGHSEGGLVALAATKAGVEVSGLILVATSGRRLGDVLRAQLAANPANAPLMPEAERMIAGLEKGERMPADGLAAPLRPLFAAAIQDFLISAMALDPVALFAASKAPALIVQGGQDLQVTQEDALLLKGVRPDAPLRLLPSMNHVLKDVPAGNRKANLAAYANPSLPLAAGLVASIEDRVITPPGPIRR
ncbi:alpha/beta fold hydrolase [Acetobacteraceae bacterium H6797]|nr:alpha/beta fold hydrolase [Acetobacteraceae bacterium H6797]